MNPQISGEKAKIVSPSDTETYIYKTRWRRMQSRANSSPENREIYRETSLDSRGCSAFRQLLPRCDEGPPCPGLQSKQGKTGNSLGISDPLAFSPNEVSEAAEFWTHLNG